MRSEDSVKAAERILDRFVEGLFRLMVEHHQKSVAEVELTLPQAEALKLLHDQPLSTSKLASSLGISAPAVSQLTDRLLRKHVIERRASNTDRRSVMVALTVRGTRIIEDFRRRRYQAFDEVFSRLTETDRAEVGKALARLVSALETPPPEHVISKKKRRAVEQPEARTAIKPANTSNEVGAIQINAIPRKRMKIEWD